MRNLKKILSLVLCMAMMLSVMVVGAGAAFSDQNQIKNTEAVDMCSALNIINGYTDGSFRPEGTITRAEACKMICIALNGGKEPVLGTNATPTFTDIKGHWAESYIEYCVSLGIVAGVGGGKFDPAGNVTGSQFAKMLLIAMGYSAETENFTGSAWEVNVNVRASQKGLYEDLEGMDPTVALTRDNAAQMIWNALNADMVEYDYKLTTVNGTLTSELVVKDKNPSETLLGNKYNTVDTDKTTGILTGMTYDSDDDEYTYTVNKVKYVTEADYTDLLGHNVTVVVQKKTDKVFGMFANEDGIVASGVMGDIDDEDYASDKTLEIAGTDYDADGVVYGVYGYANDYWTYTSGKTLSNANKYDTFVAIDNDDDKDIDLIIYYPVSFGEVKYVGSDYVRIDGMNGGKNMDTEDYDVYDGIAKEDIVLFSNDLTLKTDGIIAELEKKTAEVESVSSDDTAVLDGTTYDVVSTITLTAGDEYDFYVVNGYIVKAEPVDAVADLGDFLVIIGSPVMTTSGYYQVDALFTDGTTQTITIKEVTDADVNGNGTDIYGKDDLKNNINQLVEEGDLFTYDVSSGKYELTTLDASDLSGFDANSEDNTFAFNGKSGSDAAYFTIDSAKTSINADAVVFVKDGDDYSVITGAALKKIANVSAVTFVGAEEDNGYNYVTFAYVTTDESGSSDEVYGFITSSVTTKTDADGSYYVFDVWTAEGLQEGVKTVYIDDLNGKYTPAEQAIVTFTTDADGNINKIEAAGVQDAAAAITGLNADKDMVRFDGGTADYEIDEDTVILYINYQDKNGELTGDIEIAQTTDSDTGIVKDSAAGTYYLANAKYVASNNVLKLLVIDYTGDWNGVED